MNHPKTSQMNRIRIWRNRKGVARLRCRKAPFRHQDLWSTLVCTAPAHFVEFHLTRHRDLLVYGGTKLGYHTAIIHTWSLKLPRSSRLSDNTMMK